MSMYTAADCPICTGMLTDAGRAIDLPIAQATAQGAGGSRRRRPQAPPGTAAAAAAAAAAAVVAAVVVAAAALPVLTQGAHWCV